MTILYAILIFGGLIFVHELGHFLVARWCGIGIREFSIGMGPRLFSRVGKKSGTVYALRLFPIGGFVSMYGEGDGEDEEADRARPDSFSSKPVWQRFAVTVAGAAMNLIVGFALMLAMVSSSEALGTTTIVRFQTEAAPSALSGLQIGDTIEKIGNQATHVHLDVVYEVMRTGGEPVDVTVLRAGERTLVEDVVFGTMTEDGIVYGEIDFYLRGIEKTVGGVLHQTFYQSMTSIRMIWQSLLDLLNGTYGFEQVSGPIGTTTAIGTAAKQGNTSLLFLCSLIAMNLGIFNLLPLPALDGGRVVFLFIEFVRRKPIKPEIESYINFAGLVALLILMAVVAFKDIFVLFA